MQFLPREVILFCQIFGWFPLKYVDNSDNKSIEFSWLWCAWGLALTSTYSTLSILALHWDLRGRLEGESDGVITDTSAFTVLMDRIILCTLGIVVFVSTIIRYPRCIEMHNGLQKWDEALQLNKSENKTLKYKIVVFFLLKATVLLMTVFYYTNSFHSNVMYIPHWISHFAQATVVLFFVNVCSVFKERFCIINEKIRKEVIKQSFGQLLQGVGECRENSDYVLGGGTSLAEIRRLTELYWLLCELMRTVNRFFSWHLFVSVVSLSVHTITALFNLFSAIWPVVRHEIVPQSVLRSVWVVVNTFELLLILGASTSITEMAHSTAPMVCKLMNRNLSIPLKRHLEVFLLSLRHQNAKFSALGLFQVQNHILTPIAGAIMTYLVILIQFQAQNTIEDNGVSL